MTANSGHLRIISGGGQDLTEEGGAPVIVTILRQPVLSRKQDADGKLLRNGHVRTKEPLERRGERLLHVSSTRVTVTWGHGTGHATSMVEFALKTGRMVGRPDWILDTLTLRRLRKMAREMFPPTPKESGEDEGDES